MHLHPTLKNTEVDQFIKSADEAANAINSVDGSVAGVKKAGESEDKDANWTAIAEARTKAVEIKIAPSNNR